MDDSSYWQKDIDLLITAPDGTVQTIECKYDTVLHSSNKLFCEYLTDRDKNKPGWIQFCEADTIFYLDSVKMIAYIINTQDLKDFVANHNLEERTAPDKDRFGNVRKWSIGKMVPISDFSKEYQLQAIPL